MNESETWRKARIAAIREVEKEINCLDARRKTLETRLEDLRTELRHAEKAQRTLVSLSSNAAG